MPAGSARKGLLSKLLTSTHKVGRDMSKKGLCEQIINNDLMLGYATDVLFQSAPIDKAEVSHFSQKA